LLSTQANTESAESAAALRDAGSRVGVIARVYDRLHGLSTLDDVSIVAVIGGLVDELRSSLLPDDVVVEIEVAEINVAARLAVSLGIIVNELITNAVKYAFPAARGKISVTARGTDRSGNSGGGDTASGLDLVVTDSGGGFPADVLSGERLGYGLTIAQALVAQHEGTIALRNAEGGVVEIHIPLSAGPLAAGRSAQR
ncbi:MAG: sensor histidine kinase, partial [Alkalispirochaeta sp.]